MFACYFEFVCLFYFGYIMYHHTVYATAITVLYLLLINHFFNLNVCSLVWSVCVVCCVFLIERNCKELHYFYIEDLSPLTFLELPDNLRRPIP